MVLGANGPYSIPSLRISSSTELKLERGGEHVIWASCTKTVIFQLIYKISIHMMHQKIAYFQAV